MKTCWCSLLLWVCLLALPTLGVSQAPAPAGSELVVNSYTPYDQRLSSVSMDPEGNFVIVWTDYAVQDGDGTGVFGRLFASDGTPVTGDFQVNSYTTHNQHSPRVARGSDGTFVVVWTSRYGDPSDVFGQRFAGDGTKLGPEFSVPAVTMGSQARASVAMNPSGGFVVVWDSVGEIAGRQFLSNGTPLGTEFLVNSYTTNTQTFPSVATDGNGNFVVVWERSSQDGSGTGVFGRRFASDGSLLGDELQVNTYNASSQPAPRIAMNPTGDFVVVWQGPRFWLYPPPMNVPSLGGQRFANDGTPVGGQFRAGSELSGYDYYPSVAADQDGNFVVVWQDVRHAGGVEAQALSKDGTPLGPKIDVSKDGLAAYPSIAMNAAGEFVVTWSEHDGSDYDIHARRFRLAKESDELAVDFGPNGLWYHDGATWKRPSNWNPEQLEPWQNKLAADFGSGRGVYFYDEAGWHRLSGWDPYQLVAWGGKLVAAFDGGRGLYVHDTAQWSKLTSWEPVRVVGWGDKLACDFGPGRGLWLHDGAKWKQITTWVSTHLAPAWDRLVAAFDSKGLWMYQEGIGWTQLSSWQPEHMASWGDNLVVAFGSGHGIWNYDTNGWDQLSTWDPYLLVPWRDKLAAAFDAGRGTYVFDFTSWVKKTGWEPIAMTAVADKLVVDFGPGRGVYTYDTAWQQLTAWTGEELTAVDLNP